MRKQAASGQVVHTLHRYFITADLMRTQSEWFFKNHEASELVPGQTLFPQFFACLSLWYATLFVALNGWSQYDFEDAHVDAVLSDARMGALRDFRNATFHFRPSYVEARHMRFIASSGSSEWIAQAHATLGAALLNELRARAIAADSDQR